MGNMNTYELLRLLLLGGFAGFAVFSISYGLVVWSRRNKSVGGNAHALASIGSVLGAIGIAASLSGIVQAKLLTYTGLIESAISASDQADLEARARLGALSTVPLRIDPALTLRQSQLRIQIDQLTRFQFDLATARREVGREQSKLRSVYAAEMATISAELHVAVTALAGYPERIAVAQRQLDRALELLKRGAFSEVPVDQRKLELLTLKDGYNRTRATITATLKREAIVTERYNQAMKLYETQTTEIEQRGTDHAETLSKQQTQLATVERLIAEDGETALAVMSTGKGFVVKTVVPVRELAALKQAEFVTFEPRNIPIRSRFNGTFKDATQLDAEPSRVIATFDVRLPSDVLLQLKSSSEPIQVDAHWSPPVTNSNLVQAGGGVTALAFILWGIGRLLTNGRPKAPIPAAAPVPAPAPAPAPAPTVVPRAAAGMQADIDRTMEVVRHLRTVREGDNERSRIPIEKA